MSDDYVECKHHVNCGGWCESDEEIQTQLCADCLLDSKQDEQSAQLFIDMEKALTRIAKYVKISSSNPKEIADMVWEKLNSKGC